MSDLTNLHPFNINHHVRVKLTEHGRYIALDTYARWPEINPKPDADGYTRWQLWELMQVFGEHLHLAGKIPFEKNEIILEIGEPS